MLELEYKWPLSKEDFEKNLNIIKSIVPNYKESTQTNYYYDTDEYNFKQQNTTIRVRYMNGVLKGTIKKHLSSSENEEKSWLLNKLPHTITIDNLDMHMCGEMLTKRTDFYPDEGIILSFDENIYLGKTDYEVELEFTEDSSVAAKEWKILMDLLLNTLPPNKALIGKAPSAISKSDRYFNEKELFKNRKCDCCKAELYD